MRKLYFLLTLFFVIVFISLGLRAQPNHNVLQVHNQIYTELSGDIALTQMVFANGDPIEVKDLYGETFNLYGKPWLMDTVTKGVLIFPNAFIEVVEDSNFVICDALLRWLDSIDNNSKISYKIDGSSGNKILKVQWKNVKIRTGAAGNYVNLQIWLYQKDGMVEYRYGPSSASNASGYVQSTGPSVGISYSDFNFTKMYEKIWIHGTPPNIQIDSAHNASFPNIFGVPANGTVYRFISKQSASVTSVKNERDIRIYPNPADKEIIITRAANANETLKISLLDLNGRLLNDYNMNAGAKQLSIPSSQLPAGMYNLHIKGRDIENSYKVSVSH